MPIVSLNDVSIRFRGPQVLDDVNCTIESGQRIGLLGRNGAGKSTLMNLITGNISPDHGEVAVEAGVSISKLPQEVPEGSCGKVGDVIRKGLAHLDGVDPEWSNQNRIDKIVSRMKLDPNIDFGTMSSGMKRRVLLAQSLVAEPDLLLLDEPTNHLDIESIRWLEEFLAKWSGAILFVTHDRRFLSNLASRILEIDRGNIFDWTCGYDKFLERKNAALEAEEKQDALFDKNLAAEEAWIRQGIKARRKRNQGRVRRLMQMRQDRSQRRTQSGTANIRIQSASRSGNLIARLDDVNFGYESNTIVKDFSTEIIRGDKVGLIGPNGAGKSTLLRLILGKLKPDSGQIKMGTNLEIAYFDQLRESLDENQTVMHNVADGYETIEMNGQSRHVLGYLQEFLFPPERARTEVKFLSGGERNRLLLARLFSKPANLLVLDEPTNDLDAETLELLEEKLIDFDGTVLLVSHDRVFLNNVVTSTIAFENGAVQEYDGGYDDYLRQSQNKTPASSSAPKEKKDNAASSGNRPNSVQPKPANPEKKKLSYKEQRELESIPETIEKLEKQIAEFHETMASPDFYKKPGDEISQTQSKLEECNSELESIYQRWEELESRNN